MPPQTAIVGLGNPGEEYGNTRHNAGFMVIDKFALRHGVRLSRRECRATLAVWRHAGTEILLVEPSTFMNLSGQAVRALAERYELAAEDFLLVADDVHLPLGTLRVRRAGSAGGHNGLKSVITALGGQQFPRLRLGVRDRDDIGVMADYVLGDFPRRDGSIVADMVESACDAIELFLQAGIDEAMARTNRVAKTPA